LQSTFFTFLLLLEIANYTAPLFQKVAFIWFQLF